jgi:hypothetical protein
VLKAGDYIFAIEDISHVQDGWSAGARMPHVDVLVLRPHEPDEARAAVQVERDLGAQILRPLRGGRHLDGQVRSKGDRLRPVDDEGATGSAIESSVQDETRLCSGIFLDAIGSGDAA